MLRSSFSANFKVMMPSSFRFLSIIMLLIAAGCTAGCTGDEDFSNPLDPQNLRTAGSPIGLELLPGDEQIIVTWEDSGHEGIIGYRIYRRFTGDPDPTFEFVGEVLGENGKRPATEFVDTQDLKNDQFDEDSGARHRYIYRISYIDADGVEVPDPDAPPAEGEAPRRLWQTASATPSVAPPIPNVIVGEDLEDLTVKLFWQDYQTPGDFEGFRVIVSQRSLSGEFLPFRLRAELPEDQPYFFDREFDRDNAIKIYRIAAVDRFGVEGVKVIQVTSPNLPPSPPKNVRASYGLRRGRYDIRIAWSKNSEPDVEGYLIYATKETGGELVVGKDLIHRRRVDAKETSVTFTGEGFLLEGQREVPRRYFISAFDNTPQPNGRRDESEMVEVR